MMIKCRLVIFLRVFFFYFNFGLDEFVWIVIGSVSSFVIIIIFYLNLNISI